MNAYEALLFFDANKVDVEAQRALLCSGSVIPVRGNEAFGYIPPHGLPRCAYCHCRQPIHAVRCDSCGAPQ